MKLLAWSLSDVGRKRDHNEDSLLMNHDLALFAVADGMGGHAGGACASHLAVEVVEAEFERYFENETIPIGKAMLLGHACGGSSGAPIGALSHAARMASHKIFDLASSDRTLNGMGTTLTALHLTKDRAYFAHVGDSRAYLYRDGHLSQVTEDHSWIEEQVRAGLMTPAEAHGSSLRHIITRSVGFERDVDVDIVNVPIYYGDCFLLCSDGLSNYFELEELEHQFQLHYFSELPQVLVNQANARGGDDNISVLVIALANDV